MMETLRALAEPNRFRIVELLRDRPRPVGEMVERLGLRQPQVSKHLRVLTGSGAGGGSGGCSAADLWIACGTAQGTGCVATEVQGDLGGQFPEVGFRA